MLRLNICKEVCNILEVCSQSAVLERRQQEYVNRNWIFSSVRSVLYKHLSDVLRSPSIFVCLACVLIKKKKLPL